MKFFLLGTIFFSLINYIILLCSMEQICPDPATIDDPTKCFPRPSNFTSPQILEENSICPEYSGQLACCNLLQTTLIKKNFDSLDQLFGTAFGGCDTCAINLKRFWCHFTCHPDQSNFRKKIVYFFS